MCRQLILPVLFLTGLAACTPVRTIYDEQGNVVTDEPGGEKDLMTTFEKRFDAAFSEQKTKEGVPMTTSSRVSHYQEALDNARRIDKPFASGQYDTGERLNLREKGFADSGRRFTHGKESIARTSNAMFSTDMRPDFMNETHGISHNQRYADAGRTTRSALEGLASGERARRFTLSDYEPYTTSSESSYIESRRNKTKQPTIINKDDYYRQFHGGLKGLLGTDNNPPQ